MNKAFVRERQEEGDRCPACGSVGRPVFQATLEAHLPAEECARFQGTACFCPHPTCPVAYFDPLERTVNVNRLRQAVYPKDPAAPICPCFGLTCQDIDADVREGSLARLQAHRRQAESSSARCATRAPDGRSCIPAVQRYFMRARGS